mmetsp:Transcript_99068/g.176509  ORF Transcript_99068/g.176509 Transcript_99068/m.176509 type:complete len:135 (-) Transcript_99068:125-529(-)
MLFIVGGQKQGIQWVQPGQQGFMLAVPWEMPQPMLLNPLAVQFVMVNPHWPQQVGQPMPTENGFSQPAAEQEGNNPVTPVGEQQSGNQNASSTPCEQIRNERLEPAAAGQEVDLQDSEGQASQPDLQGEDLILW